MISRHQRQDDDRGDGRRRSSSAPARRLVHNRAGREHGRRRRLRAGRRLAPRRARARRRPRALRGRRVLARRRWSRSCSPRALLLANLFRDQLDRYGELETIADRWAAVVAERAAPHAARAQRRRPAGRRPRPRRRGAVVLRRRGRRAGARRAPARLRLQALPPLRRTPTSTTPSTSATSAATTAPTAATAAPSRAVARRVGRSCAASAPPPSRCARPQGATRVELPLPGLYNVYNALGAAALCLSLGVDARRRSSPGSAAVAPAFGRAETIDLDGRPTSILLVKNPAGANEVLRTLALEGGELDLFGVLNDRIADGRDVSWVWDADWELLAPHVRAHDLLGHARRRARAADEVRGRADRAPARRRATSPTGARRRAGRRRRPALRPAHLHGAARAARPARPPRRRPREYWR